MPPISRDPVRERFIRANCSASRLQTLSRGEPTSQPDGFTQLDPPIKIRVLVEINYTELSRSALH